MELKNKSAVVTGGASGLGLSVVRRFEQLGARVVVADVQRGENDLGEARFVECDVTDGASMQAAVDAAVEAGPLGALVCCAGLGGAKKILGKDGPLPLADYSRIIQVNLVGSFNSLRLAAWAMRDNEPGADGERGVIVLTSSLAAYEGQVGQAAYSSSKAGLVGLTLPAARELARFGVRVVTIAPGIFDTPMLARLPDQVRQALGESVPFPKRLGRPEEYASLVVEILQNQVLNGTTIRLDGALRLS